jgi:acetyltransferase
MPDHMPIYPFPEAAARGLAALDRYRHWRSKPLGQVRHFHLNGERVAGIFERARAAGRGQLDLDEAFGVAEACGIPLARYKVCSSAEAAVKAAGEIGWPVALKIASGEVVHKVEVGGVALGLTTPEQITQAYSRMAAQDREGRVVVQAMVPEGRETILGATADPHYGPVLMFGLGGIFVETLRDVVFRMVPITDADADDMIRQIRGHALLEGVRGQQPVAFGVLQESLERLSQLVSEFPEIVELDINPFFASPDPQMSRAVDVRIRINLG